MRNLNLPLAALGLTGSLAIVIAFLTLKPGNVDLGLGSSSDKISHFLAFAALVMPTAIFFKPALVWVIPASIIFGGAIELIQPSVGRSGEFLDFVADAAGVVFAVSVGYVISWIRKNRSSETGRP
jgi:hypothetical protein